MEFEKWAVPAPGRLDASRRKELLQGLGDSPSAERFALPEEGAEEAVGRIAEEMYSALDDEWMEKLRRGPILVERELYKGVRYGIVAAIDLEAYTHVRGETSPIMPAQEGDGRFFRAMCALRERAPLEFPHTVIFFKDKKKKIFSRLLAEDLELLYDFELTAGGGRIKGSYISEPFASWALSEMHSRGEPCFVVGEGVDEIDAAKAHWEGVKGSLCKEELQSHPARFALAELCDINDEGVEIFPMHRIVCDTDPERLISFFSERMACKRDGNILTVTKSGADIAGRCDEILEEFLREREGKLDYVRGAGILREKAVARGTVGILLNRIEKEDIFSAPAHGRTLAKNTFTVGRSQEGRYLLEAREIGYD